MVAIIQVDMMFSRGLIILNAIAHVQCFSLSLHLSLKCADYTQLLQPFESLVLHFILTSFYPVFMNSFSISFCRT